MKETPAAQPSTKWGIPPTEEEQNNQTEAVDEWDDQAEKVVESPDQPYYQEYRK